MKSPNCLNDVQKWSDSIDRIDPEPMKAALKLQASKNGYSFAGGVPSSDLLPSAEVTRAISEFANAGADNIMQYGNPQGLYELRDWIAHNHDGCAPSTAEEILITQGAQQGIYLAASSLASAGDTIITVAPTYFGAMQVFKSLGLAIRSIELLDKEGVDLDYLEHCFSCHKPKLLYITSNFHNPTGLCLPEWQKEILVQLSDKYGVPIIEDDVLGQVYFDKRKLTLKNLSAENVIYLGSFSKIVAPGMRVGFISSPKYACDTLVKLRSYVDVAPVLLAQRVIHSVCSGKAYHHSLDKLRRDCKLRKDALLACLASEWDDLAEWTNPEGGLFTWLKLHSIDARILAGQALKQDVAVMPGNLFYADHRENGANNLRLSWATLNPPQIHAGMNRLRTVVSQLTARKSHAANE